MEEVRDQEQPKTIYDIPVTDIDYVVRLGELQVEIIRLHKVLAGIQQENLKLMQDKANLTATIAELSKTKE